MRVRFIGTGSAFDARLPNTSALLEGHRTLLLDCGPTVPAALWAERPPASVPDALYVSHLHGDHIFGIPFLLARLREAGRRTPLTLVGQAGVAERVEQLTRLAYRSVFDNLGFPLASVVVEPGRPIEWEGWGLSAAESSHSQRNLALRVDGEGVSFCYSGDGDLTDATRALYAGADLVVHETFAATNAPLYHAAIDVVVAAAQVAGVRALALVHLEEELRTRPHEILAAINSGQARVLPVERTRVLVPEPGDVFDVAELARGA